MEIGVKRNTVYTELIIKDGGTTLETGLLDKGESLQYAEKLIDAAYYLIPDGYDNLNDLIIDSLESIRQAQQYNTPKQL